MNAFLLHPMHVRTNGVDKMNVVTEHRAEQMGLGFEIIARTEVCAYSKHVRWNIPPFSRPPEAPLPGTRDMFPSVPLLLSEDFSQSPRAAAHLSLSREIVRHPTRSAQ